MYIYRYTNIQIYRYKYRVLIKNSNIALWMLGVRVFARAWVLQGRFNVEFLQQV